MAIHCDNNTLEVVNIYTQQQLFTVKIPEPDQPAKKILSKTEFVLPSVSEPLKPSKPKRKEGIVLVNFFNLDNSSLFMGVITRGNKIYHYSQKGNVTLSVNLDKRSGEGMDKMLMIYAEECLVLATRGDITVLHRQSYYKKWVISISTSDLVQVRRVWLDDWEGLTCIDTQGRIFLVDVNTRRVENISSSRTAPGESNCCKFNETLIYE